MHLKFSMTSQQADRPLRVFCYGDSLTAGTVPGDFELYPYAPHLEKSLRERNRVNAIVRHRGLPGWTASNLLDNVNSDQGLATGLRAGAPIALAIILAGTNDLGYEMEPTAIVKSILGLHKVCFDEGVQHTIAIGIPSSGYQQADAEAGRRAQAVNKALEDFCKSEARATYVPFPFDFARNNDKWAGDRLHFSSIGYQTLGTSLAPIVEKILLES
jgi:lysophospholipase L1-like esterase